MGMYTKFYLNGIIKKEFIPALYSIVHYRNTKHDIYLNQAINELFTKDVQELLDERINFCDPPACLPLFQTGIPLFMNISDDHRMWFLSNNTSTNVVNPDSGEMTIISELKDYNLSIEKFLATCLYTMKSIKYASTHYESDSYITVFDCVKSDNIDRLQCNARRVLLADFNYEYFEITNDRLIKMTIESQRK